MVAVGCSLAALAPEAAAQKAWGGFGMAVGILEDIAFRLVRTVVDYPLEDPGT
jgi:hypothetical protein